MGSNTFIGYNDANTTEALTITQERVYLIIMGFMVIKCQDMTIDMQQLTHTISGDNIISFLVPIFVELSTNEFYNNVKVNLR